MQSRLYIVFYVAFQICFAQLDIPSDQIIHIKAYENKIEKFSTLILDIELNLENKNPFNPDEIKVNALINSPSQRHLVLPAFYHSDDLRQIRLNLMEETSPAVFTITVWRPENLVRYGEWYS